MTDTARRDAMLVAIQALWRAQPFVPLSDAEHRAYGGAGDGGMISNRDTEPYHFILREDGVLEMIESATHTPYLLIIPEPQQ